MPAPFQRSCSDRLARRASRRARCAGCRCFHGTLPQAQRRPRAEYERTHIPGAVFFDIDEICDQESPYPHMLPAPEKFSSRVRALGLGDGTRIVVYDGAGLFSAARVWWMFRVMGHDDVAVLDGGLRKWKAEDRPLRRHETPPQRPPLHRAARHRPDPRSRPHDGQSRHARRAGARRPQQQAASTAPNPNRAPACAAGTFRVASTCRPRNSSPPTARSESPTSYAPCSSAPASTSRRPW